jgi:hypothetical protein
MVIDVTDVDATWLLMERERESRGSLSGTKD